MGLSMRLQNFYETAAARVHYRGCTCAGEMTRQGFWHVWWWCMCSGPELCRGRGAWWRANIDLTSAGQACCTGVRGTRCQQAGKNNE